MQDKAQRLTRHLAVLAAFLAACLSPSQATEPEIPPLLVGSITGLEQGQDVSGTKVEFVASAVARATSPPGWTHIRLKSMKVEIDGTTVFNDTAGTGWIDVVEPDPLAAATITKTIRFMSNRFADGQAIELKVTASMEAKQVTPVGTLGPVTIGPESFAKTVYAYNKASLFQRTEFTEKYGIVWWGGTNPHCPCPWGGMIHNHGSEHYARGAEASLASLAVMNHFVREYLYDSLWPIDACLGYLGGSPVPAPPTVAYFNSHGLDGQIEAGLGPDGNGGLEAGQLYGGNVGPVVAQRYSPPFNIVMIDACDVASDDLRLMEAFLGPGSSVDRAVVGWTVNVDDRRTSIAMGQFWSSLGSGKTTIEAAEQAELRYFGKNATPPKFLIVGDNYATLGRVYTGVVGVPRTWYMVLS